MLSGYILDYNKISDQAKLKAFADNKVNATKMIIYVFDRVENIVGKGEIACTSNFSFSPQRFQKASFPDQSKGVIVWESTKQQNFRQNVLLNFQVN